MIELEIQYMTVRVLSTFNCLVGGGGRNGNLPSMSSAQQWL
jgi:hypothetical protein